jgi:transketolase
VLNAVAAKVAWLFGGDADLGCSTKTLLADEGDFEGQGGSGRNIRFGVREHAMAAICNGLDYHGGIRPYAATFFVFCDYMRPSVRMAALNGQPVIYVWTHDSVAVGEDGPTHQPIEQLMSLRSMLNLAVVRPSDGNEAAEAWRYALARTEGPTALVLSRQKLPVLDRDRLGPASGLHKGAYVLAEAGDGTGGEAAIDAILIATGSEVATALEAREILAGEGVKVRVVAMPCWEEFAARDRAYQDAVLPPSVTARVSVEAGVTFGWEKWVGPAGSSVGVDRFGASAPGSLVLERFGITARNVAERVKEIRSAR